jgi:hypothetical protein
MSSRRAAPQRQASEGPQVKKSRLQMQNVKEPREQARLAIPDAARTTDIIELTGHKKARGYPVTYIVQLHGGERVATISRCSKVRIFLVATGMLEIEIDTHEAGIGWRALASLGDDCIATGAVLGRFGQVATWCTSSGVQLGNCSVASTVFALATIDSERFAAGTSDGCILVFKHHHGKDVAEIVRIENAHDGYIRDISVCGDRLASASEDRTAAVWDVTSRERFAVLRGHNGALLSVDMNQNMVVTSAEGDDSEVRVYNVEGGYTCTAVFDWIHSSEVKSAVIIGNDHLMTASIDSTLAFTKISSSTVIARAKLDYPAYSAAALSDGRIAVCGSNGNATLMPAPAVTVDMLQTHGAGAAFESAVPISVPAAVQPPSPQQRCCRTRRCRRCRNRSAATGNV